MAKTATRGLGRVYLPKYKDRHGQVKESAIFWLAYPCRRTCGNPKCSGVHRESTGTDNRTEAVKVLRNRHGQVSHGRLTSVEVEKTAFADLAKMIEVDYEANRRKSPYRLRANLKHLKEAFGGLPALAITTDKINAYIAERLKEAMPATVQNELATLGRMFTLGVRAEKVAHRPYIPNLVVRNTRTGFFEVEDFQAVLEHLPDYLKPLMEFFYLTGWRKGDVLPLQWRNVDFQAGEVRLEPGSTKNDEGRTFPFSVFPPLGALLKRQRARTTALEKQSDHIIPWVFHRHGEPIKNYDRAWKSACKNAGIPDRHVHDFRRTVVRTLERASVPRSTAMALTGHKTERVFLRYAIVSPADLKEGVAKLARLHETREAESLAVPVHRVVALKRAAQKSGKVSGKVGG